MTRLVDLSQEIYQGMPVAKGLMKTVLWYHETHHDTRGSSPSFEDMGILISEHAPTHVDAVSHVSDDPDAPTIDKLPLEMFYTEAICLDVSSFAQEKFISLKNLKDVIAKEKLAIKKGDTVLLYTGHYDKNYGREEYVNAFTGLDIESARWLADQGVVNIGVDAPSADGSECNKTMYYPVHMVCKEKGILNTENLANLQKVAGKRFVFVGFPLKIRNGTGSPIRAVAIVGENSDF